MVINLRGWRGIVALAAVIMLSAVFVHAVVDPAARVVSQLISGRLVPIYRVEVPDKRIALSFDATWGTEYTDTLLDILARYGVKTTFFLAGNWVKNYPEYVKKIDAAGHELGNHSYSHPHLNSLSPEGIREEIAKLHNMLKAITGKDAVLFRPPFGEYSNKVIQVAESLGYYTIQWSVDSLDWKNISRDAMIQRILSQVRSGDIVLFHNAGIHTADAVNVIIPTLQKQGYQIVPISELIYKENFYVEPHSGTQRPKAPGGTPPLAPERGQQSPRV